MQRKQSTVLSPIGNCPACSRYWSPCFFNFTYFRCKGNSQPYYLRSEIALHAADTGHLVFSTLHTLDAKETVNRIISDRKLPCMQPILVTLFFQLYIL